MAPGCGERGITSGRRQLPWSVSDPQERALVCLLSSELTVCVRMREHFPRSARHLRARQTAAGILAFCIIEHPPASSAHPLKGGGTMKRPEILSAPTGLAFFLLTQDCRTAVLMATRRRWRSSTKQLSYLQVLQTACCALQCLRTRVETWWEKS